MRWTQRPLIYVSTSFGGCSFRKTKAAVKLHTLLDLRGNLPTFIHISDGKMHDVKVLDELIFEPFAHLFNGQRIP